MRRAIAAAGLAATLGTGALAQSFFGIENDPMALNALNEMTMVFGNACAMGDQSGCYGYSYVQDLGGYLAWTGGDCRAGVQEACMAYQQAYFQLDTDYGAFRQSYAQTMMQQPQWGMTAAPGFDPLGSTHEERMANIANWGAQTRAQGAADAAARERQHQQFMDTLLN